MTPGYPDDFLNEINICDHQIGLTREYFFFSAAQLYGWLASLAVVSLLLLQTTALLLQASGTVDLVNRHTAFIYSILPIVVFVVGMVPLTGWESLGYFPVFDFPWVSSDYNSLFFHSVIAGGVIGLSQGRKPADPT